MKTYDELSARRRYAALPQSVPRWRRIQGPCPKNLAGLSNIDLAACVLIPLDLIPLSFVIDFRLRIHPCFRL